MRTDKYLLKIGLNPSLKGFEYLCDAIDLCLHDRTYLHRISLTLYPTVAKMNNTTPEQVERNIRYALTNNYNKQANKEFIATAVVELSE